MEPFVAPSRVIKAALVALGGKEGATSSASFSTGLWNSKGERERPREGGEKKKNYSRRENRQKGESNLAMEMSKEAA